jgi:hypothetical protein
VEAVVGLNKFKFGRYRAAALLAELGYDRSGRFGLDLEGWTDRPEATRGLRGHAIRLLGPMPGWFDLHATR